MAELFGMHYGKADLFRRIGRLEQIAGIREYTYNSGRADGVKAIEVNTGPLRFELLPSRCLDIASASYKGVPFGYFSKSGIRHPAFFSKTDPSGFLDNFFAGALSTCGFNNIGSGREIDGKRREQHGELGNMPAEKVSVREEWDGDDCVFTIEGQVGHSRFYGEDMVLHRRVRAGLGQSWLSVEDEVENRDFSPSPCLLLYHAQFGFPFLDAVSRLVTSPLERTLERPGTPAGPDRDFARFSPPVDNLDEICFYHTFKPDSRGWATACLFNPRLGEKGMGAYVRFDTTTLPIMVEWKMLRSREYVLGLEPASASLDERSEEEMRRVSLAPMEKRRFRMEMGVLEGEDACRSLIEW